MVFCYIIGQNSKTFLVVLPRFLVVHALERLTIWKFDLGDPTEVEEVNLPRLSASRRPRLAKSCARPLKRLSNMFLIM